MGNTPFPSPYIHELFLQCRTSFELPVCFLGQRGPFRVKSTVKGDYLPRFFPSKFDTFEQGGKNESNRAASLKRVVIHYKCPTL